MIDLNAPLISTIVLGVYIASAGFRVGQFHSTKAALALSIAVFLIVLGVYIYKYIYDKRKSKDDEEFYTTLFKECDKN